MCFISLYALLVMTLEVLKDEGRTRLSGTTFSSATSRRDAALVESLATRLAHEAGLRVWLDRARLQPGFSWRAEIETAMNESAAALIVWGPSDLGPVQRQSETSHTCSYSVQTRIVISSFCHGPRRPQGTWANMGTWLRFASSWTNRTPLRSWWLPSRERPLPPF